MFALAYENSYHVSTNAQPNALKDVCQLLRETHWASGRSTAVIRTSMENSLCFYMYLGSELCGFARVITDYATFAYLCDVVIASSHQKNGCGSLMIQEILNHEDLAEVSQWRLKTTYAADFYRKFGFTEVTSDITHMEYYPFKAQ